MAGMVLNNMFGQYGPTAQQQAEAAAKKKQEAIQLPYQQAQPSTSAAGNAAGSAAQTGGSIGAAYNVDQYGNTSYNNASTTDRINQEALAKTNAQLAADAEGRRLATLRALMQDYGGGTQTREAAPSREFHDASGAEAAARAGAFARAKDMSGALAASQLRGVQGEMAGRGLSGSPLEALRSAGVLGGARGGLDAVLQKQLDADLQRAGEISDLEYQGNITQRGQDINRPYAGQQQLQALMSLMGALY